MGAGHGHHHGPHHHGGEAGAGSEKRLLITLVLAAVYMLAEAVGGYLTGSLALLADAGHMLSDVAALGLSVFAIRIARRPPTPTRTYGHHRTEILAALANGATLVAISLYILIEAARRLGHPPAIDAPVMMAVAGGGLIFNLVSLVLLHGGRGENLNVRGAWLHVASDALGSAQTIVAGALVWAFGWRWADPVASIVIALLVIYSSWSLLREAVGVLMEGVPAHVDVGEVREALAGVPGVLGVHDLHVWTITSGRDALSAHLVMEEGSPPDSILCSVRDAMHDRFGIHHVTVQIEPDECGGGC
ncbi:MAG: cation diffusion facilitator family transporter [Acidobacteriota bacterium]|nr:cation diffusion facilitator family transporter [Acidobacteriota bacterium]